jgi:DNA-binding transcriptional regulator YiaG
VANSYAGLTELQLSQLLVNGDFVEICHDDKKEVQKWESGGKQPSGMALKLLAVVQKHGLGVLS